MFVITFKRELLGFSSSGADAARKSGSGRRLRWCLQWRRPPHLAITEVVHSRMVNANAVSVCSLSYRVYLPGVKTSAICLTL